ncbi:tetratricopeptide repeat protein [Phenylobacterium sp.]|uniref:tetratricopeptide repeat protein n=1 Tax=Phenylobacterium sp. TaxID=1871053 RepID=UPI003BAB6199
MGLRLFSRLAVCAGLMMVLSACATTVDISARFPARYAETANIRQIAVAGFDGYGGREFQSALQAELFSATFDGRPYFTVVATGGPSNPSAAAGYGRSVGAQGVILGTVGTDFNTSTYQGSESRCVRWEGDKCKEYKSFPIPCWRRNVDLMVTPSLVSVATGRVVYSAQKRASRNTSWCGNEAPSTGDLALVTDAQREILGDIRRDIAPYNTTLSATLKTKGVGLSEGLKPQFTAAVKATSSGDMAGACQGWTSINSAQPGNLDTVYDLGVCAESAGDYGKALALYRQAQRLSPASDNAINESINRAQNLADAKAALARSQRK